MSMVAMNALGNITKHLIDQDQRNTLLYVQRAVRGLRLELGAECVEESQDVLMNATVEEGTDVSFNWKMDDETELIGQGQLWEDKKLVVYFGL